MLPVLLVAVTLTLLGLVPVFLKRRMTIRDMDRELREHLQYRLDKILSLGSTAQFLVLIALAGVVILLGGSAYFFGLLGPENQDVPGIQNQQGDFWDTVIWSIEHILDAGAFIQDYGATWPITLISLFLSIMGLVLLGLLVGFIFAGMEARLESLRKGNSIVKEKSHVLILGWSNKVFSIVKLLDAYDPKVRVVILSEHDIVEMREALRLGVPKHIARRVILRTGSRTNLSELHRVAFDRAYSIIVLTEERDLAAKGNPDVPAIKSLMVLAAYRDWKGLRPKMVAEISRAENFEAAQIAGDRRIPIILSSEVISKILVQSSRQPGLSTIYQEIFSFHGNEIYVRDFPGCAGKRFDEIGALFSNAVPIGVSSARIEGDRVIYIPHLNPPGDRIVDKNEWIILVAANQDIHFDANAKRVGARDFTGQKLKQEITFERVLVLGWNHNLYQVLREFDAYLHPGAQVTVASMYDDDTANELLRENLPEGFRTIEFTYQQANYVKRSVLQHLLGEDYHSIIVLADTSTGDEDVDARIIMAMLMLRDVQRHDGLCATSHVVSEITSVEHRSLLEGGQVSDIVVSPDIVSMLLTQISQQQMLITVYADLLDAGGNEIYLKPASRYVPLKTPVTFRDVTGSAIQGQEVAIGVLLGKTPGRNGAGRLRINPHAEERLEFDDGDKVIVIGKDLFD
jgi:ion channel POLLUX/CASTOR